MFRFFNLHSVVVTVLNKKRVVAFVVKEACVLYRFICDAKNL